MLIRAARLAVPVFIWGLLAMYSIVSVVLREPYTKGLNSIWGRYQQYVTY
jgi:hypothetical protein